MFQVSLFERSGIECLPFLLPVSLKCVLYIIAVGMEETMDGAIPQ